MMDDGCDPKTERDSMFFMPQQIGGHRIAFNDANGVSRVPSYLDTKGDLHLVLRDEQGRPDVSRPEAASHDKNVDTARRDRLSSQGSVHWIALHPNEMEYSQQVSPEVRK